MEHLLNISSFGKRQLRAPFVLDVAELKRNPLEYTLTCGIKYFLDTNTMENTKSLKENPSSKFECKFNVSDTKLVFEYSANSSGSVESQFKTCIEKEIQTRLEKQVSQIIYKGCTQEGPRFINHRFHVKVQDISDVLIFHYYICKIDNDRNNVMFHCDVSSEPVPAICFCF
jgi:hypothetical protein